MFFGCTMNMSLSTVTCFCFYDFFFNVFSINFKDISHLDLLLLLSVLYWFKEKPSEIFLKNGALHKNTIFREKRLYWGLFLTNLWAFRSGTVLKRDSDTGNSCEICKNFKNTFFEKHVRTAASLGYLPGWVKIKKITERSCQ